jgi:3-phenylpropionate/trans-cinnamate dioxygenase ferredoxin reductase subunit
VNRVVIVGAGLAGGRGAVELRRQGFTGRITLVGGEPHLPYDRPPLSKAVLSGRTEDTTLDFDLDGVEFLAGRRATGLRPGQLDTDRGTLDFDGLIIATGAAPVTLPGDGPQRALRTIDDARALRDVLKPGCRLVIVGAGWIGAEVATAAAKRGAEVTVVEAGPAPLAQALGEQVGACTVPWYAQAGVTLRLGTGVEAVREGGLDLRGGEALEADEVVVGVGVRPDVGWLGGALVTDRGIAVDERLSATWEPPGTDGPPVVAAGDCAAWWSRRYGTRLRVEHWDNAQHAPAVAAATLLGGRGPGREPEATVSDPGGGDDVHDVYDPVPYFWSEQFGHMVQFAGHRSGGEAAVWRGSPGADDGSAPAGQPAGSGGRPAGSGGRPGGSGGRPGGSGGRPGGSGGRPGGSGGRPGGSGGRPGGPGRRAAGWSVGWFGADGRLVALVTVDRPLDMVQGRRLIQAGTAPDPERFADISIPLKQFR